MERCRFRKDSMDLSSRTPLFWSLFPVTLRAQRRREMHSSPSCLFRCRWLDERADRVSPERWVQIGLQCLDVKNSWLIYASIDITSGIREYTLVVKNPKLTVITIDVQCGLDENTYNHEVFRVTLKDSAEEYIIDLTGAQYGYHDTVIPISEYFSTRVAGLEDVRQLGWTRQRNIMRFEKNFKFWNRTFWSWDCCR